MGTSLLQVRIDDSLKNQTAEIFDNLGIDTSTDIRMFLKRVVKENGIPFSMTLPTTPYVAEHGYEAMLEMNKTTKENGLSDMTLDEINTEIESSRKDRKIKKI